MSFFCENSISLIINETCLKNERDVLMGMLSWVVLDLWGRCEGVDGEKIDGEYKRM